MNREYHTWWSPNLNRDMELLIFGHHGARVIVFPTSQGKFYEWEDRGMIDALGHHLEQGWLQLYCVDSVDAETWYCDWCEPHNRVLRHIQYEQYVLDEVLALSREKNDQPFLITAGASFGAYHALNIACRHPDRFDRVLGMSGIYDIRRWMDGYYDENTYFNNPIDYLQNEHDPNRLNQLRGLDIIITVGEDDQNFDNNKALSEILWEQEIWHAFRVWDGWAHDWPHWQQMLTHYIGGVD